MFDIPTNFFHGNFNYLKFEIFISGIFTKSWKKLQGTSRKSFLGQNYHLNPIGHLFSIRDVTYGSDFSYSLVDALLKDWLQEKFWHMYALKSTLSDLLLSAPQAEYSSCLGRII